MKSQIPSICKKLYQKNLIAGFEGNVSEKKNSKVFITPSQVSKSEIKTKDLCCINLKGENLNKNKPRVSSEKHLHLAIYQTQKTAQAIIHAHPPCAIALSLARPKWKFLTPALPEMIVTLGQVPFVAYTCPGTKQLGETIKPFIKNSKALILSHHGAVTWAENLNEAFLIMEQLEQCCKILALAESMGGSKSLSSKQIKQLLKK